MAYPAPTSIIATTVDLPIATFTHCTISHGLWRLHQTHKRPGPTCSCLVAPRPRDRALGYKLQLPKPFLSFIPDPTLLVKRQRYERSLVLPPHRNVRSLRSLTVPTTVEVSQTATFEQLSARYGTALTYAQINSRSHCPYLHATVRIPGPA